MFQGLVEEEMREKNAEWVSSERVCNDNEY